MHVQLKLLHAVHKGGKEVNHCKSALMCVITRYGEDLLHVIKIYFTRWCVQIYKHISCFRGYVMVTWRCMCPIARWCVQLRVIGPAIYAL